MIRGKVLSPNLEQMNRMREALRGESDRGNVLISATVLDEILKRCLDAHFVDHKDVKKLLDGGVNAPLGSFSARILTAFAIGIIGEPDYRELDTIRKIRNEFAHSVEVSFGFSKVINLTNRLLTN